MIQDDGLPSAQVLDNQAELSVGDRAFPAVYFPIGTRKFSIPAMPRTRLPHSVAPRRSGCAPTAAALIPAQSRST
jgi:hypothetical protein